jgi:hypothetical protein
MPHSLPAILLISVSTASAPVLAQLSGKTTISLGEALAAFVFSAGLVAWLSRKLQRIEDEIEALKKEMGSRPCQKDGSCPPRS